MNRIILKFNECEKLFGFENKIKWFTSFKIISYHVLGVWWIYQYAFPAKILTILFFPLMFAANGIGVTVGAHRLFTHKSYKVTTPLKIFILICFSSAGQNSIYQWVRDHRLHHKFVGKDGDPHNASRGLFFSHIGWLMMQKNDEVITQGKKIDMSDVENDKYMMFFHRNSTLMNTIFCFILPTLANMYLWGENFKCAVAWQCFIRFLYFFHTVLTVNSFAHTYGYTPFNKNILAKDSTFLGRVTFGEGWHNYHHVFATDYKAAEYCDFFNIPAWIIRFWNKMGWAYDLQEVSPEIVHSVAERLGDGVSGRKN